MTGDWRKMPNGELHEIHSTPNVIKITTSRTVGWAGHVARIGRKINKYKVLIANPKGKRPL